MQKALMNRLMETTYEAAATLLNDVVQELLEASMAARDGQANQARGIAIGVEGNLDQAKALLAAIGALNRL